MVLHPDQGTDRCWRGRGVGARQPDNFVSIKSSQQRGSRGRIVCEPFAELVEADGVLLDIVRILQSFSDDYMHHPERQRRVRTR